MKMMEIEMRQIIMGEISHIIICHHLFTLFVGEELVEIYYEIKIKLNEI